MLCLEDNNVSQQQICRCTESSICLCCFDQHVNKEMLRCFKTKKGNIVIQEQQIFHSPLRMPFMSSSFKGSIWINRPAKYCVFTSSSFTEDSSYVTSLMSTESGNIIKSHNVKRGGTTDLCLICQLSIDFFNMYSYLYHFLLSESIVELLPRALEVFLHVEGGGFNFEPRPSPNVEALHVFGAQLVDDGRA